MTHVLRVIWDVEFDGDTHFHIGPKFGRRSGKNGPFWKLIISRYECPYVIQLFSGLQNVICFDVRQLEIPKIVFQKSDMAFSLFPAIARPKIKMLA